MLKMFELNFLLRQTFKSRLKAGVEEPSTYIDHLLTYAFHCGIGSLHFMVTYIVLKTNSMVQ